MFSVARVFSTVAVLLVAAVAGTSAEEPAEFVPSEGLQEGWYARIETSMGRIVARLLPEQAPQSVAHFAALAESRLAWTDIVTGESKTGHYYDGIVVHLARAGQRFEAGDRSGTGRGAPMMYVPEEGAGPLNFHQAYRLGMTRGGGGRISAVQFFVTASAQPWLSRRHPCFGEIVEGKNAVFNISQVKTYSNGRPIEPVTIDKVRIFSVGDPDPLPDPVPHHPSAPPIRHKKKS